ncbi:LysM peptidoglycan-binding domain-containing protein [Paenibacillus sp. P96]|uniref:LysM peptidoglycan-binding domain-containing protein n=1 Tax=Paenibacillus zeirhizosphaerae TaxID=2987519 RepID=A0ABT9FM31_9BACL|nr:LysM peptidoglycan-binding domain-containing protein [Paenibacillus sp. P96]MDP4095645.1 LysM peptidoglycan-binding domain-containing protein [Paenibacillus sp. P96]
MKIHILKKEESLHELSQKFKVPLEQLVSANPHIENPDLVVAGTKIRISSPASALLPAQPVEVAYQHKVKQGDSLWKLGKAAGIPLKDMIDANPQLKNPNALMTGEIVNIPKVKGEDTVPGQNNGSGSQGNGSTVIPDKKNTGVKEETASNPAMPYEMFEMPEIPEMPPIPQLFPENANMMDEAESESAENEETEKKDTENVENIENTDNMDKTNNSMAPENILQGNELNKPYEMPIYEPYSLPNMTQPDVNNMYPGIMAEQDNSNMPAAINPAPYSEDNKAFAYNMMYSNYSYGENVEWKPKWEAGSVTPVNSKFGEHHYQAYPNYGHIPPSNAYMAGEPFVPPFYPNSCSPTLYTAAPNIPSNNDPYMPTNYSPYMSAPTVPQTYYQPVFPQPYGFRTELNQNLNVMVPLQGEQPQLHSTGLEDETYAELERYVIGTAKSRAKAKIKSTSAKKINRRKTEKTEKRKQSAKPKRKNPWLMG